VTFEVIPAIDLRGGRVVRLRRGEFDDETAYGDDPVVTAIQFANAGARWIHIVDLDGARSGRPAQGDVVRDVIAAVDGRVWIEVSGGLREASVVNDALMAGASRVVIGTAALRDPAFAADLIATHGPERVAVAIDVRDGQAVGEGWQDGAAGVPAGEAMARLHDAGVTMFELTAIARDGLLEGPDLDLLAQLVSPAVGSVIASGGISSLADVRAVADLGCAGAIIGRALYEDRIDLGEAVAWSARVG
jgi:phosphoribosylformimino-5-aminoimidazole carboxamide ribotide isomerase